MNISRKILCGVYASIALAALVGTWGNNLPYLGLGAVGGTLRFWQDTLANPASRSITVDIFFYGLAVTLWMLMEARRLRMRGVWLYVVFGMLIAVSFTFPLFMIQRERALEARGDRQAADTLSGIDIAGLVAITTGFLAYTVLSLSR